VQSALQRRWWDETDLSERNKVDQGIRGTKAAQYYTSKKGICQGGPGRAVVVQNRGSANQQKIPEIVLQDNSTTIFSKKGCSISRKRGSTSQRHIACGTRRALCARAAEKVWKDESSLKKVSENQRLDKRTAGHCAPAETGIRETSTLMCHQRARPILGRTAGLR
jgi:hypothetical protein